METQRYKSRVLVPSDCWWSGVFFSACDCAVCNVGHYPLHLLIDSFRYRNDELECGGIPAALGLLGYIIFAARKCQCAHPGDQWYSRESVYQLQAI